MNIGYKELAMSGGLVTHENIHTGGKRKTYNQKGSVIGDKQ